MYEKSRNIADQCFYNQFCVFLVHQKLHSAHAAPAGHNNNYDFEQQLNTKGKRKTDDIFVTESFKCSMSNILCTPALGEIIEDEDNLKSLRYII